MMSTKTIPEKRIVVCDGCQREVGHLQVANAVYAARNSDSTSTITAILE